MATAATAAVKSDPTSCAGSLVKETRRLPGVAAIKPMYIVKISETLPVSSPPGGQADPQDGATQVNPCNSPEKASRDLEPPPAKKRKRGQNKHRPRPAQISFSEMLCSYLYLSESNPCPFGAKCRYMHDIGTFMASKLPNIAESCHIFATYGKCQYGRACRFGNCHLTSSHENIVDDKVYDAQCPATTVNMLSKALQVKLRKRKFNFFRTEAFLRSTTKGSRNPTTVQPDSQQTLNRQIEGVTSPVTEVATAVSVSINTSAEETCVVRDSIIGSCDTVTESHVTAETDGFIRLRPSEKKKIDPRGKLYLAPLTTVGNLPFRRICKEFGADITCGEMAMCTNLLQGQQSEWALIKRHQSEDLFGAQVCGAHIDSMTRCAELLNTEASVDFVDINIGCPIDLVFKKGAGCALMGRATRFEGIVRGMVEVLDCPLTVKMRTGIYNKNWTAHKLIPKLRDWGVSIVTLHGRSREQHYTKMADWEYINSCAAAAAPMPLFGNGDILSYEDYNRSLEGGSDIAGTMIARGALIKPWIFTEIKEQRHWDISSTERLDIIRHYVNYGLEHWGSDTQGVENTRKFLLEWLSFLYRYIPVGVLETVPQKINERPPTFVGRNDLETLMSSNNCKDWVLISEMLLGPVPDSFSFIPKHKANSYN